LAQVRPPTAGTAVAAFTCGDAPAEVTLVVCCNTTGSAAKARLYHDDSASGFSQANALWYDKTVPANDVIVLPIAVVGGGLAIKKGGIIGVGSDTNNALTFSIYGVSATLAQRVSAGRG